MPSHRSPAPRGFVPPAALTFALLSCLTGPALAQAPSISTIAGGGPDDIPALSANLEFPRSIAVDGSGSFFLSTEASTVLKVDATGHLTVVAGTGLRGDSGDGGPAVEARLATPWGVAVDPAGDLYIADLSANRVRRVDALTGIITTVAGNGSAGFCGDGGLATQACLAAPGAVTLDAAGHLYIVEWTNLRVRKVDAATGIISTVAGAGIPGFAGDGGPATQAAFNRPMDVAVDSFGNLYIADSLNHRIRRVDAATGIITTVAGNGAPAYAGDGGPATSASLYEPWGVAIDDSEHLLIAEFRNHRIRKMPIPTGIITTVAGTGTAGPLGDGGLATSASLYAPSDVTVDPSGDLLISQDLGFRARRVARPTQIISTVAGNGEAYFGGDGQPVTRARLNQPRAIALAANGDLFIADTQNLRLRKVDASTGILQTVACNGQYGFGGDGGPATQARCRVAAVAVDAAGNLFFSDVDLDPDLPNSNNRIRKVDAATGLISTYAGTGGWGLTGDGGPAANATLGNPAGLAVSGSGDLYLADRDNNCVRKVAAATGIITTVAGGYLPGFSGDGGPATLARFRGPEAVTFDASGDLLIADTGNRRIRRVDAGTGIVSTVAGNGQVGSSGDGGPALDASFVRPTAVAVDAGGGIVIADDGGHRVRRVDPATAIISALAGQGSIGFEGDGGPASLARLDTPSGLAVDGAGRILIADTRNDRVRRLGPPNSPPVAAALTDVDWECTSPAGAPGLLDGLGSGDADSTPGTNDDIAAIEWFEDYALTTQRRLGMGATLPIALPLGAHRITLRVEDRAGSAALGGMTVAVRDTTAPAMTGSVRWPVLWPPYHHLLDVRAFVEAADVCGPATLVLESVTSSEPDDRPGPSDGATPGDIEEAAPGMADFDFRLRAERDREGTGRLYTATYAATDAAGNVAREALTFAVPLEMNGVADPLRIDVRETAAGTLVEWTEVPGAFFYTVVRGRLANLMDTGSAIDLGDLVCLQAGTLSTSTAGSEDGQTPLPGEGFFYLVAYNDGPSSTYGEEDAAKPRVEGPGGCP